jgi:hypothetical protein
MTEIAAKFGKALKLVSVVCRMPMYLRYDTNAATRSRMTWCMWFIRVFSAALTCFRDRQAAYASIQTHLKQHGENLARRDQEIERRRETLVQNSFRVLEGNMEQDKDIQPDDGKMET